MEFYVQLDHLDLISKKMCATIETMEKCVFVTVWKGKLKKEEKEIGRKYLKMGQNFAMDISGLSAVSNLVTKIWNLHQRSKMQIVLDMDEEDVINEKWLMYENIIRIEITADKR